jgi:hypothetical protein
MEPQNVSQSKRFRLIRLEERVVPSHLPAVAAVIVAPPAFEHAPTHAHKVDFAVFTGDGDELSGRPHCNDLSYFAC